MTTASESAFKHSVLRYIENRFPGAIVLHVDTGLHRSYPDVFILYRNRWAALEFKRSENSKHRPNQDYYVDIFNAMSYASFIYPENEGKVLNELEYAFRG